LNIRRRGLSLGSIAHVNLPDLSGDKVASQSPPANASRVSAPKINLLVSDGPEPLTYVMPSLIGQPLGSATLTLQDAGIKLGKVIALSPQSSTPGGPPVSGPGAASMVFSQSPLPGQKVAAGSAVNLEVR
jgi:beta-lactam-binding protein with PASTA domain